MDINLVTYRQQMEQELDDILVYWSTHAIDPVNGGYHGRISNDNQVDVTAPRGSVLYSRICWSFSAAYNHGRKQGSLDAAARVFDYIRDQFVDREHGGVYWTVDHTGAPLDQKKQVYALAFTVYALSEYFIASGDEASRSLAIAIYHDITRHSHDEVYGGYLEALTRDWQPLSDLRLSNKDANEKKSMNTHLHLLEGFANLYRIWPDKALENNIRDLLDLFIKHIIAPSHHLQLFFDEQWLSRAHTISYGHDIEASWLLLEAAVWINDAGLMAIFERKSIDIANAAAEGLDADGGLWYEAAGDPGRLVKEKHWWPQAEAMVGFFNAWQITGEKEWLQHSMRSWSFVYHHLKDHRQGEWFWGIDEQGQIMAGEDKVGLWKCPYHNSRACLELIKRISQSTLTT